ncbi:CDP-alcohol phosphatidyltransferase [Caulobacter sp. Root655]|uniref:CDP-alcohol phosphatidyltransferase family protein n=1 Tax=Caulobacter sp. Root655 TaxID=1736578 RepID=UPI0006F5A8D2|nr:CDP-alcohol phosphatidyltransferase family protein [Caulobacter sp. Root655]KRA59567.1 CDP-alcohol phosphatidyltransferase [Caulobacter sp. Root655]
MTPRAIPYLLIALRVAAGLLILALALLVGSPARWSCAALLAVGVLSDIFDGVIARRLGSVTDRLRIFDSRADVVFWLCATAAVLILHPRLVATLWPAVLVLGVMELTAHAVSFARFRREASPHHLLSKLFGLALWALLTQLLITGTGGLVLAVAFAMGVASQLEALAIMLILPDWRCDIRGVRQALALRRAASAA